MVIQELRPWQWHLSRRRYIVADKYMNFQQLSSSESRGAYRIELRQNGSSIALIAPHAGKIEPGTSEICRYIAGDDLTYYLFEGAKLSNNSDLHITSSRFDEPQGLAIAESARFIITFHGQSGEGLFVNVGGLASDLCQVVIESLIKGGYFAERQADRSLQGLDKDNICNRGSSKQGVQLEISRGLRNKIISDISEMKRFGLAIRSALRQCGH
ncbi:TPA: poly-gamma-glutamate hydrolase family protein [Citrobacter koseri]|uniref:poly-gamma-glutamate hydrolase family protein n=1 Tax=Enterobacteriaceae TaxID=543 RepID=UPI00191C7DD9|nr:MULTISPECIES: poly-gamma-glutamate hydrolase family protein [Enterobacteriaceae]HCT4968418.1 poly-gamma-glutamate hydrolase family protein [Citrobacter koseri]HCU0189068.1 poly-gamma-glutamate hydrolase family protein [Citrobacter koseri]